MLFRSRRPHLHILTRILESRLKSWSNQTPLFHGKLELYITRRLLTRSQLEAIYRKATRVHVEVTNSVGVGKASNLMSVDTERILGRSEFSELRLRVQSHRER